MKRTCKSTGLLLLALVMIACSGTAVRTVEVTRVVPQTVVVTEALREAVTSAAPATAGGFTTGTPVDVSSLPALATAPAGGEPMPCFAESPEPSISWGYGIFPSRSFCLNNFPTASDSPGFTMTLTDPTGQTFQQSFTYQEADILDARGEKAGWVQPGGEAEMGPATPGVIVGVYMPASFPCGNWLVSARTQDGRIDVAPTALNVDCSYGETSVLPDLAIDPFTSHGYAWEGPDFSTNQTFYVVGAAYPPDRAVTVAFYQVDPAAGKSEFGSDLGTAKYAVSVLTDHAGSFQVPFVVGTATLRGAYYAVVAPSITPDMRLGYFDARFSIK